MKWRIFERIFRPWTKWEIYKSDIPHLIDVRENPILGGKKIGTDRVMVDIYVRKHKFNGLKEYRRVVKYF